MIRSLALAAVLLLAGAPAASAADAPTGALTVTFKGFKAQTGAVMLQLAGSEAAYDGKAPAAGQAMARVSGATATASFTGLAPGRYAVKAFHDVDGDGKMTMNPFGIPTEPFAFSNNAHGAMGPAAWADAAFEVTAGANAQTIDID